MLFKDIDPSDDEKELKEIKAASAKLTIDMSISHDDPAKSIQHRRSWPKTDVSDYVISEPYFRRLICHRTPSSLELQAPLLLLHLLQPKFNYLVITTFDTTRWRMRHRKYDKSLLNLWCSRHSTLCNEGWDTRYFLNLRVCGNHDYGLEVLHSPTWNEVSKSLSPLSAD